MVKAVESLRLAVAVGGLHLYAGAFHIEFVVVVIVILAAIAVYAVAVGRFAERELYNAVVLAHRFVILELHKTELLGRVVGRAHLREGDDEVVVCNLLVGEVVGNELVHGVFEAGKVV